MDVGCMTVCCPSEMYQSKRYSSPLNTYIEKHNLQKQWIVVLYGIYYCIVSKLSCHANFTHEQFKSPNQKPHKHIIIKHEDLSYPWRLTGLPLQIVASAASGRRWVPPTDSTAACHARQERIRCRTGDGPSGWPREDAHRLRQEKTTVTPIFWSWR